MDGPVGQGLTVVSEDFEEALDAFLGHFHGVIVVLAPGDTVGEGGDGDEKTALRVK